MEPQSFPDQNDFRVWLKKKHAREAELLVGFYKTNSGKPSMTWPESVDQALCFGWIDGVRRSINEESYSVRFTPRKKKSTWSAINIRKVDELTKAGLMQPAGIAGFEQRKEDNSKIYSYENEAKELSPAFEKEFQKNKKAWEYFNKQAPSYKRTAVFNIMNAKTEETSKKRLARLIKDSEAETPVNPYKSIKNM